MKYQQRKPMRLKNFDYFNNGAYFITICTKDKKKILSKVSQSDDLISPPNIVLTNIGKIIKESIEYLKNSTDIRVDNYVIMPNHIHLLLVIENFNEKEEGLYNFINRLKSFTAHKYGKSLWQRSYYDHIIRDEKDYLIKWQYIEDNPVKWTLDEYY